MSGKKNRKLKDIVKDFKGIYKFLYRPLKSFNLRRALILSFSLLAVLGLFLWFTHGKTWAAPWSALHGNWAKRKQLTLVNNSGSTINSNTTYQVTINTKDLYTQQAVKPNCDDIRVVYQPNSSTNTELKRNITTAQGAIDCRDSTATIISFPLQATITNGSTDANYYVYYANPGAPAYSSADALSAYNVGAKQATFVAPFNGTTTALAAGSGTPTTATGAIRYSGGKSALSFEQNNYVQGSTNSAFNLTSAFTLETWVYVTRYSASQDEYIFKEPNNGQWGIRTKPASSNKLNFFYQSTSILSDSALSLNSWHHIAGVFDGSTMSMFVDGKKQASTTSLTTASVGSAAYSVSSPDPTQRFYGYIDEVRISSINRYSSNFTPSTAPFVRDANTKLLLHFDENGDDPRNTGKAIDDSGNGNNGTITGAKYVSGLVGVDASTADTGVMSSQSYAGHQGVFIEEGTTNKITNPSFENSTAYDTNWAKSDGTVNYSATHTFTPAVSKRTPPAGPFAAGLMVQGGIQQLLPADYITFSPGSSINGNFFPQFDSNQGTMIFWFTPEWNGNDGLDHVILWNNQFQVVKNTGNAFVFWQENGGTIASVGASGWSAGSTYLVILRWDFKNTIDGSHYASITVNNATTFGNVNSSPVNVGSTYLGVHGSYYNRSAGGIIQGLTIYRRPLYEASTPSGINVGNGDEISQIYNSGSGKDPTLVTGSWDVVFALPTNSSTGSLTTGTGNAWSHPHSSNLLYTNTTNTGGFMMNGTFTSDGWAAQNNGGSAVTVGALSTANKIFSGGYSVASAGTANQGIYYTTPSQTTGSSFVVRAIGNSDGTCNPQVKILRADNSTEITHLNGTTTSTRTAPDTYIFTFQTANTEAINVALLNQATTGTCSWHQVEVLSNLVNNPSLESGTGDPWIPTNWSVYSSLDSGDSQQNTSTPHSGSSAFQLNSGAVGWQGIQFSLGGLTAGKFLSGGLFYKTTSGSINSWWPSLILQNYSGTTQEYNNNLSNSSWKSSMVISRNKGNGYFSTVTLRGIGGIGSFDDVYQFSLSDVSLTVTPVSEANSTESTGLRVGGATTLTQTITNLDKASGTIEFQMTPRHSFANAAKFGFANPVIATAYYDANNYLKLFYQSSTVLRLTGVFNGTTVNADYATPTLNAGTTYSVKITYAKGGNLVLSINGSQQATASMSTNSFATVPNTIYFGSDNTGSNQYDLTVASVTTSATVTANTTAPYYKFGATSAKIVATDAANYTIPIAPGNANPNGLSVYVYDGTSGNVGGTIDGSIASLLWEGNVVTTTYTDMGSGWWRLQYGAATTNATNNYGVHVADGKTVYIDGVQLEEKNTSGNYYITSYADGSLGTGYAWTGVANNSTSTRSQGLLNYPSTNNINVSNGTISFWVKTMGSTNGFRSFFGSSNNSGGYKWTIYTQGSNLRLYSSECSSASGDITGITYTNGSWKHIVYSWSGRSVTGYLNGGNSVTSTLGCDLTLNQVLNIGAYDTSGSQGANVLSDFRIFSSALSSSEVTDLYNAGLGAHAESAETMKDKPSLYWKMDEGTGTTAQDSSGNNLTGVISSATYDKLTTSNSNTPNQFALTFNGTSSKVSRAYNFDGKLDPGTDSFSVSSWFRHTSTVPSSGTHTIVSRYSSGGYKLYMNTSGYICFGIDSDSTWTPSHAVCSTATQGSYADSRWHMAEGTKDSVNNLLTLYLDGVQVAQTTITDTASLSGSSPTFYVGVDSDGASNYWAGSLDEVKYFSNLRSSQQIKSDYAGAGSVRGVSTMVGNQGSLSQGLVGYWKMDEASGSATIADSSGNGNTGTWNGTGVNHATIGKYGNGGGFNGSDDYTKISDFQLPSTRTFSAWINPSTVPSNGTRVVFAKRQGMTNVPTGQSEWFLYIVNGKLSGAIWNGIGTNIGVTGNSNISASVWSLVTMTYDGSKLQVFVNGLLDGTTQSSFTAIDGTTEYHLGDDGASNRFFQGTIDDARIYNRALSPAEVSQLYNWAPGPVARYTFEEGQGTIVNDVSGNGNTGTWNGTGSHWTNGKVGKAGKFNGSDDYVDFGRSIIGKLNAFTVSMWVNYQSGSGVWSAGGCSFTGSFLETTRMFIGKNTYFSQNISNPLDVNKWSYISFVYGNGSVALYKNGQLYAGPYTTNQESVIDAQNFRVGGAFASSSCTDLYLNGQIDDVRIYNYTRTQKQIIEDMQGGQEGVMLNGSEAPASPAGGSSGSGKGRIAAPVAYYKFDEGQGTVANNSGSCGNGCNGTLTNMSSPATATSGWTQSGKFGKGLNFNGTNNYVNMPTSTIKTSIGSISLWFKSSLTGNNGQDSDLFYCSLDSNNRFGLVTNASDHEKLNARLTSGGSIIISPSTSNSLAVTANNWHHAVFTTDGTSALLYIDGSLKQTTVTTSTFSVIAPTTCYMGRYSVDSTEYYSGTIDEVKIFPYALTAAEVKQEYNHGSAEVIGALSTASNGKTPDNSMARMYCPPGNTEGNCAAGQNPAPVAEWNFEEGQGSTVADSSGNNNAGTWNGTGSHWTQGKIGKAGKFNGSDDQVITNSTAGFNVDQGTYEIWINPSYPWNDGQYHSFVQNAADGNSWIHNIRIMKYNNNIFLGYNGDYSTCAITHPNFTNNWFHLTGTWSGSGTHTGNIYVNGILQKTCSFASGTAIDYGKYIIGQDPGGTRFMKGSMDNIKVFNYARTPAQIAWDYNRGAPVAWWKMDECTSTTINDMSGNGNTGTLTVGSSGSQTQAGTCTDGNTASAWYNGRSGKRNAGLSFDGSDDFINMGDTNNIEANNSETVSAWVNISNSVSNDSGIICKDNPGASQRTLCLEVYSGKIYWYIFGSNGLYSDRDSISAVSSLANNWHHIVGVWDGSNVHIYIDGTINDGSQTYNNATGTVKNTTANLKIGTYDGASSYYKGLIDDVRVYNYALSPTQIQVLYNDGAYRAGQ